MRIWKRLVLLNKGTGKPEIDTVKRIPAHTFTHTEKKNLAILKVATATPSETRTFDRHINQTRHDMNSYLFRVFGRHFKYL